VWRAAVMQFILVKFPGSTEDVVCSNTGDAEGAIWWGTNKG